MDPLEMCRSSEVASYMAAFEAVFAVRIQEAALHQVWPLLHLTQNHQLWLAATVFQGLKHVSFLAGCIQGETRCVSTWLVKSEKTKH